MMPDDKVTKIGPEGRVWRWDDVTKEWILSDGIALTSPDGSVWKITVGDLGTVNTQKIQ